MIPGYDEWKTRLPEEPKPKAFCDFCERPLYEGEYIYVLDGESLCLECLNDSYRRML